MQFGLLRDASFNISTFLQWRMNKSNQPMILTIIQYRNPLTDVEIESLNNSSISILWKKYS